MNRFENLAQHS